MTQLSVNLNKVALLRNARDIGVPSVLEAARICIEAGVGGITVHPRPDMRHIRPQDVDDLAEMLTVEFNIEGNPFSEASGEYPGLIAIVRRVRPNQCTLVPDTPGQRTSDHGWDTDKDSERLRAVIGELKDLGVRVSLFMDPDIEKIERAAGLGADRVELYTEAYARAYSSGEVDAVLERYRLAAKAAQGCGLGVNAGHDLDLENLARFLTIEGIMEVSIGHALISDAIFMGLAASTEAYLRIVSSA